MTFRSGNGAGAQLHSPLQPEPAQTDEQQSQARGFGNGGQGIDLGSAAKHIDADKAGAGKIDRVARGIARPGEVKSRTSSGTVVAATDPRQVEAGEIRVGQTRIDWQ